MNNFYAEYETYRNLDAKYEIAEKSNDTKQIESAIDEFQAFEKTLLANGNNYFRVFELYRHMRERGNEFIDVDDIHYDEVAETLVTAFRDYDIKVFTVSVSSNRISWALIENGCQLKGMTLINSKTKRIASHEYEKVPAYIFEVK